MPSFTRNCVTCFCIPVISISLFPNRLQKQNTKIWNKKHTIFISDYSLTTKLRLVLDPTVEPILDFSPPPLVSY